jgi:hypothetical protein
VGKSGENPRPRQESALSVITALATPKVAETMIGDITLGKIWRKIIRRAGVLDREAITNSRSFSAKTSPRTIRAVCIQDVTPIAITIRMKIPPSGPNEITKGPRNTITISKRKVRARNRSVKRIKIPSRRRKYPASTPTKVPSKIDRAIAVKPTAMVICPPAKIRASMSRPNWSVPSWWPKLRP